VDPIGYEELLCLMVNSRGVITDSGTVVEEACGLAGPFRADAEIDRAASGLRRGSSVKFDPAEPDKYPASEILRKLEGLRGKRWSHNLGDGKSSERIASDLHKRILNHDFARHKPEHYHVPVDRCFREDGLP